MFTKFLLSAVPYVIANPALVIQAAPVLVAVGVAAAISDAAKKN